MKDYSCSKWVWETDLDFGNKFHLLAIPYYKNVFGNDLNINTTDGNELDRKFSIDCIGEDKNKLKLYLQEKFLRFVNKKYNSLTIEYMSNVEYKVEGAYFNLNVDYYIFGYGDKDEKMFESLYIFKWNQLKNWIQNHFYRKGIDKFIRYNYKHSRASFLAIPIDWIPKDIIKFEYHKDKTLFGYDNLEV